MKRWCICVAIVITLLSMSFLACSKGKDAESEKGTIDKITDHAADNATKAIRTPIDKARTAQEKESERTTDMERALTE